jgi:UrcA family protein
MKMMARNKAMLSLVALGTSMALAVPAYAGERSVEVRISDLDLARPSAQAKLQERVTRAVRNVCRSQSSRAISERAEVQRCETEARAKANMQISARIAEHKAQRLVIAASRLKLASD